MRRRSLSLLFILPRLKDVSFFRSHVSRKPLFLSCSVFFYKTSDVIEFLDQLPIRKRSNLIDNLQLFLEFYVSLNLNIAIIRSFKLFDTLKQRMRRLYKHINTYTFFYKRNIIYHVSSRLPPHHH